MFIEDHLRAFCHSIIANKRVEATYKGLYLKITSINDDTAHFIARYKKHSEKNIAVKYTTIYVNHPDPIKHAEGKKLKKITFNPDDQESLTNKYLGDVQDALNINDKEMVIFFTGLIFSFTKIQESYLPKEERFFK
jgi:hypothetical protein